MRRILSLVLCFVLLTPLAFGQQGYRTYIFPQFVQGGTQWRTDLTVTNKRDYAVMSRNFSLLSQTGSSLDSNVAYPGTAYPMDYTPDFSPGLLMPRESRVITLTSPNPDTTVGYMIAFVPTNSQGEDEVQLSMQYTSTIGGTAEAQVAVDPQLPCMEFGSDATTSFVGSDSGFGKLVEDRRSLRFR
jgi:hypothetical protein